MISDLIRYAKKHYIMVFILYILVVVGLQFVLTGFAVACGDEEGLIGGGHCLHEILGRIYYSTEKIILTHFPRSTVQSGMGSTEFYLLH